MTRNLFYVCLTFAVVVLLGCAGTNKTPTADYDRQLLLTNVGENIIIPAYSQLGTDLSNLVTSKEAFWTNSTESNLEAFRLDFIAAYTSFQYVTMYDFGPADVVNALNSMNIFPADTTKIESNISSETYDLNAGDQLATKGFPALDYLLYGLGKTDSQIIDQFDTATAEGKSRRAYVNDVLNQINERQETVLAAWNSIYLSQFIAADGVDAGSSTSLLVNNLNMAFEDLKRHKLLDPSGIASLTGTKRPTEVEAYYSGESTTLLKVQILAIQELFNGLSYGDKTNQDGFDDYLNVLGAQYNGGSLSTAICDQFNEVNNALETLIDPLSNQITTDSDPIIKVNAEMQKLIVLLKTDLPSALSILITYQDGDGD